MKTKDRTKVFYLIGSLDVGGAEKTLVDLVNNIDKLQYNPKIYTIKHTGAFYDEITDDVPVHSLNATSKIDIRAPIQFSRILREEKPDILQSFLFFDNSLARLTSVVSPKTSVITGVRSVPDRLPLLRDISDRGLQLLSDHIVSNSKAGAEWVIDRGADSNKVSVIPNGRDINKYASATASTKLINELNLFASPIVGTVGRLLEIKGHFDMVHAWPDIIKKHPNAELLFVGEGPAREELEQLVIDLDISENVTFAGQRNDVPELLDLMDVFVFPSHYEGLPGALIEAMAAGLPIVTTPVGGIPELIENNANGIYVTPESPDSISEGIHNLLENKKLRVRLGEEAENVARDHYSLETMVAQFEDLYDLYI